MIPVTNSNAALCFPELQTVAGTIQVGCAFVVELFPVEMVMSWWGKFQPFSRTSWLRLPSSQAVWSKGRKEGVQGRGVRKGYKEGV